MEQIKKSQGIISALGETISLFVTAVVTVAKTVTEDKKVREEMINEWMKIARELIKKKLEEV